MDIILYILIGLTIILFILIGWSIKELIQSRNIIDDFEKENQDMKEVIVKITSTNKQIFQLYTTLSENQSVHTKALELLTKQSQNTLKDFNDFRQQVSDALIVLVDHFEENVPSVEIVTKSKDDDKNKLN